jgi:hypothetical protein
MIPRRLISVVATLLLRARRAGRRQVRFRLGAAFLPSRIYRRGRSANRATNHQAVIVAKRRR